MIDGATLDQRTDMVTILERAVEALQDDRYCPFAAYIAIGAFVERLTSPVGAEHPRLSEGDEQPRSQRDADAPNDCDIAFAGAQRADCTMHGDERTRACRIDRLTG